MTPRRALSLSLAAFAFLLPLSIAGMNAALAAVSAAVLWAWSADARRTRAALAAALRSPAFLALAACAAWEAVSALGGLDPAASLRLLPKDLHKLWAFAALSVALSDGDDALVAPGLAAGAAFGAFVGLGQSVLLSSAGRGFVRAHAFIHPVSFGEILGLALIAALAFLARPRRTRSAGTERRWTTALAALLAAALILNETRAVLVAAGAALAAGALADERWRRRALAALLALAAIGILWEALPTHGHNIRTLFSTDPTTSSQRSRFILWEIALDTGREHPLFGVGSGQFHRAFEAKHPEPLDGQAVWGNAHNLYLHQFAERGLPGLIVLLATLGVLAGGAWRAARARAGPWALAAWAGTAAFLVMNLTETAWQTEQVGTLFLFLWLLGAGPHRDREIL